MSFMRNTIAAAVLAVAAPVAANAIPVDSTNNAGNGFDFAAVLSSGSTVTYDFEVGDFVFIDDLIFGGSDNAVGNLMNVMFGVNGDITNMFTVVGNGTGENASGRIDLNQFFNAGDTFSVAFDSAADRNVSVTLNFDTVRGDSVNPIPVPAAGVLLGGVMAAGAFASRRRSKKAAA